VPILDREKCQFKIDGLKKKLVDDGGNQLGVVRNGIVKNSSGW
jgi:hypothetical protein